MPVLRKRCVCTYIHIYTNMLVMLWREKKKGRCFLLFSLHPQVYLRETERKNRVFLSAHLPDVPTVTTCLSIDVTYRDNTRKKEKTNHSYAQWGVTTRSLSPHTVKHIIDHTHSIYKLNYKQDFVSIHQNACLKFLW